MQMYLTYFQYFLWTKNFNADCLFALVDQFLSKNLDWFG